MKSVWKLVINTGYDWEETDILYFSKKEYAEKEALKHSMGGCYINKIWVKK